VSSHVKASPEPSEVSGVTDKPGSAFQSALLANIQHLPFLIAFRFYRLTTTILSPLEPKSHFNPIPSTKPPPYYEARTDHSPPQTMSSRFDPSFEQFLNEVFDFEAACDGTDSADNPATGIYHADNTSNGMEYSHSFREEVDHPYQQEGFRTAGFNTAGIDQGDFAGTQQDPGLSVQHDCLDPALLDVGAASALQQSGPIGVSFFFRICRVQIYPDSWRDLREFRATPYLRKIVKREI
jgi:hypothetical protein